jgi:hypothetical protein
MHVLAFLVLAFAENIDLGEKSASKSYTIDDVTLEVVEGDAADLFDTGFGNLSYDIRGRGNAFEISVPVSKAYVEVEIDEDANTAIVYIKNIDMMRIRFLELRLINSKIIKHSIEDVFERGLSGTTSKIHLKFSRPPYLAQKKPSELLIENLQVTK